MADTLKPRPRGRTMLVLLGVLLLGVVAAGWGLWSRIRARHGRDNGWQHLRPASRPAPAAIPASAAPDTVAASATAASPEPGTRRVPDNPPAPEAAAELTPTPRPGHAVEPAAGTPGRPGRPSPVPCGRRDLSLAARTLRWSGLTGRSPRRPGRPRHRRQRRGPPRTSPLTPDARPARALCRPPARAPPSPVPACPRTRRLAPVRCAHGPTARRRSRPTSSRARSRRRCSTPPPRPTTRAPAPTSGSAPRTTPAPPGSPSGHPAATADRRRIPLRSPAG